jgi:hypothetical protein
MSELLKPPTVPVAIQNFFASQPDFFALAGDMSEEFQQRAQSLGANAAKRWYWHETLRNALALTWRELLRTPVRTTLVAVGCLLAVNAVIDLYAFLRYYPLSVLAILDDQRHRNVNLLLNFIACLAMGWIGGRMLRGREWALALTFTLITACTTLPGAWYLLRVLKVDLPVPWWEFMIVGTVLRQAGFWVGCLWIRRSRSRSRQQPAFL